MLVFFAILFSYISPVANFVNAWRGSHEVDADLASLRQEHDQLDAKAAALKSPNAIAAEARRLGLLMEGELSFVSGSPSVGPRAWRRVAGRPTRDTPPRPVTARSRRARTSSGQQSSRR